MMEALQSNTERVVFSVNGVETTGYLHRKNETGPLLHTIDKNQHQFNYRPNVQAEGNTIKL